MGLLLLYFSNLNPSPTWISTRTLWQTWKIPHWVRRRFSRLQGARGRHRTQRWMGYCFTTTDQFRRVKIVIVGQYLKTPFIFKGVAKEYRQRWIQWETDTRMSPMIGCFKISDLKCTPWKWTLSICFIIAEARSLGSMILGILGAILGSGPPFLDMKRERDGYLVVDRHGKVTTCQIILIKS